MIDILVPVLGRPANAAPLVASIEAAASVPYEIHFLCSPGDEGQIEAARATGASVQVMTFSGAHDYPRKMNAGYWITEREWILLAADDLDFESGWDEIALALDADVIGTNDRANGQVKRGEFSTHSLVRRRYVTEQGASADGPGVLMHEGYDHNFCDRELAGVAKQRGVWAFASRSIIRHRHPLWRTAPWDDTYRKGQERFREDQALFWSRSPRWEFHGLSPAERKAARERGIVRA